jgi:hypothetical protein
MNGLMNECDTIVFLFINLMDDNYDWCYFKLYFLLIVCVATTMHWLCYISYCVVPILYIVVRKDNFLIS